MNRKKIAGFLAGLMLCGAFGSVFARNPVQFRASAAEGRLYNQYDPRWLDYTWDGYATEGNSMYSSACGIFSFCNAIYSMNGIAIDALDLAQWAYDLGAFRPGGGGTYRDILYDHIEQAWGEKYHFKLGQQYFGTVTQPQAIEHLKSGGVIVMLVPYHFIAITGYDENSGKFRVIESAVSTNRNLLPDGWVTGEKLSDGRTNGQWFILISNTKAPEYAQVTLASGTDYAGANELIDFVMDSDTRNSFALGIDNAAGVRLDTIYTNDYALSSRQHCFATLPAGDYSCYCTGSNAYGMVDSPRYYFHVYEGAPESIAFKVGTKRGSVGKPIDLTVSGGLATYHAFKIERSGKLYQNIGSSALLNDSADVMQWTPTLPGEYSFSAMIRNSYGELTSETYQLTIDGKVPVTLDPAGGTLAEPVQNIAYLSKYGKLPVPDRAWWQFDGWFTEAEAGEQISADTRLTNPDAHTLYAHWTKIYQRGDLNVDDVIDTTDAQLVLEYYLAGLSGMPQETYEPIPFANADINGDGTLDSADAQLILLHYVANTIAQNPTDWEELLNPVTETTTTTTTTATTTTTTVTSAKATTAATTATSAKATTAATTATSAKKTTAATTATSAKATTAATTATSAKATTAATTATSAKATTAATTATSAKATTAATTATSAKAITAATTATSAKAATTA